jgi:hypothetical protein
MPISHKFHVISFTCEIDIKKGAHPQSEGGPKIDVEEICKVMIEYVVVMETFFKRTCWPGS